MPASLHPSSTFRCRDGDCADSLASPVSRRRRRRPLRSRTSCKWLALNSLHFSGLVYRASLRAVADGLSALFSRNLVRRAALWLVGRRRSVTLGALNNNGRVYVTCEMRAPVPRRRRRVVGVAAAAAPHTPRRRPAARRRWCPAILLPPAPRANLPEDDPPLLVRLLPRAAGWCRPFFLAGSCHPCLAGSSPPPFFLLRRWW